MLNFRRMWLVTVLVEHPGDPEAIAKGTAEPPTEWLETLDREVLEGLFTATMAINKKYGDAVKFEVGYPDFGTQDDDEYEDLKS